MDAFVLVSVLDRICSDKVTMDTNTCNVLCCNLPPEIFVKPGFCSIRCV